MIELQLQTSHEFIDLEIKTLNHECQVHSLCFVSTNSQPAYHILIYYFLGSYVKLLKWQSLQYLEFEIFKQI